MKLKIGLLGLMALVACGPDWITPQEPPSGGTVVVITPPGDTDGGDQTDGGTPDAGTPDAGGPDAGTPDAGTPDGGCPLDPFDEDDGKVKLCHVPAGDPAKAKTLRVGANAAAAHLRHGDYLGECR
jgi:hypothetical protein